MAFAVNPAYFDELIDAWGGVIDDSGTYTNAWTLFAHDGNPGADGLQNRVGSGVQISFAGVTLANQSAMQITNAAVTLWNAPAGGDVGKRITWLTVHNGVHTGSSFAYAIEIELNVPVTIAAGQALTLAAAELDFSIVAGAGAS